MVSTAEIRQRVESILVDLFEVEPDAITDDARLYEDLDIDSIDAVDMMVELKNFSGKKIAPDDFKSVRTVGDVIAAVEQLMGND